jgi:MoxR-like ATPase
MDSSYVKEVKAKVKSAEFGQIVSDFAQYGQPTTTVNTRLKVYFGPAGTGKTTEAQRESDNRCIVCNSSMLPSDLMEDFIFKDGNPDFNPSLLWNCMEQGQTIVLDEINLLPFDSLRFLQGIVDGKTEFYYKNRPVHIHEGFQIIGTMNLSLGGMVYGLPEPLVDRCADAKQYELTAEQLAKAVMGWSEEV